MLRMEKFHWAILSGFLNLCGAVLLFYSLQISSTNFMLVTLVNGNQALCAGRNALFVWTPNGLNIGMSNACSEARNGKPTAMVNSEHPDFIGFGLGLMLVGFPAQLFSIEKLKHPEPPHVSYGPRQRSPKSKGGTTRGRVVTQFEK